MLSRNPYSRALALATALVLAAGLAGAAEERASTFQPFVKGDIFVASTIMDHPTDDHMGTGRIFQYDAELNLKGELYTKGTTHKIGGLNFAPDGTLWAFAQGTPAVVEIGPDGVQKPVRSFSERSLSSVTFARDGSLYFGEHLQGPNTTIPTNTTVFNLLTGRDVIGDGNIFKFSPDARLLQEFHSDTHGGVVGIHGVTSTVLTDDDMRMVYLSETGNRVMQYDLANDRQLPDLRLFDDDENVFMVLTLMPMLDGSLLISTGNGLVVLDKDSGETLRYYDMRSPGWAASGPTVDGAGIIVGNFFTGEVVIISRETGEVVRSNNIGQRNSLSGVAQFPG
ncbi:MAG: hypothetical protein OXF94_02410 [Gammaproteobacteria bacterium]|nr:hypothetical protein [Gammaproteobacteria bacterium]